MFNSFKLQPFLANEPGSSETETKANKKFQIV